MTPAPEPRRYGDYRDAPADRRRRGQASKWQPLDFTDSKAAPTKDAAQ